MKTTKLKNERSQSRHHSQSHTGKGGAGELHESKIRFPPPLFSPYGWLEVLEVTARVSQLTGPCNDGGTTQFLAWL